MTATVFQAINQHCADSGEPSPLPPDFESGPYYRAYFENQHGEQWIFWYNRDTRELDLRGGDCGWEQKHKIVAVTSKTLTEVLMGSKGRKEFGNILPQCLLAGQHMIARILGNVPVPLLFVLTLDNHFVTLNGPEHLWVQACVAATRVEIEPLSNKSFHELVVQMRDAPAELDDDDPASYEKDNEDDPTK